MGTRSTNISKLNLPNLTKGVDNLSPNLVGHIELDHTHVRRAEHGVLCWRHDGGAASGGGGELYAYKPPSIN